MKNTIIIVAVFFALVFSGLILLFYSGSFCIGLGCTGDYHFNDTAIYYAPKSDFKIIIQTSGFVPDGHDLGDGKANIKMFRTKSKLDTIRLKTSTTEGNSITWNQHTEPIQFSKNHPDKLYDFLDSVGINNIDSNEIAELTEAMVNVNFGHKSAFCEGQTKYIEVIQRK
ncbi:hypothetical protein [uncultured Maribacter sp.]|uniref:hypothetical protein n=1 Tax=uncultured Maribacter sp. TaxID=431308 RepID=UPI0030EE64E5|tara:strand:+ start:829 stop:1335 length:507 start_codon:yes stop_codon:yes gene_type:complete